MSLYDYVRMVEDSEDTEVALGLLRLVRECELTAQLKLCHALIYTVSQWGPSIPKERLLAGIEEMARRLNEMLQALAAEDPAWFPLQEMFETGKDEDGASEG